MRLATFLAGTALMFGAQTSLADGPPKDDEVARLVRQLGSGRYGEREVAAKNLVELGTKARSAIKAGTMDGDAEVARRCQSLLKQFRAGELAAFLAGKAGWPEPSGQRFFEVVGDTEAGRKLFVEMIKDDARADRVERAVSTPREAPQLYASEVARVEAEGKQAIDPLMGRTVDKLLRDASRKAVTRGDVLAVLFLGTFPVADAPKPENVLTTSFVELGRGPEKEAFQKLFLTWLARQTDPKWIEHGFYRALWVQIPGAAPIARRLLKEGKLPAEAVPSVLLYLGHLGEAQDVAAINAFRDDDREYIGHVDQGVEMQVQFRDLATAMALTLRGEDFTKYGLEAYRPIAWFSAQEEATYRVPLPLPKAFSRDTAHKEAWAWLDEKAKRAKK